MESDRNLERPKKIDSDTGTLPADIPVKLLVQDKNKSMNAVTHSFVMHLEPDCSLSKLTLKSAETIAETTVAVGTNVVCVNGDIDKGFHNSDEDYGCYNDDTNPNTNLMTLKLKFYMYGFIAITDM